MHLMFDMNELENIVHRGEKLVAYGMGGVGDKALRWARLSRALGQYCLYCRKGCFAESVIVMDMNEVLH